MSRVTSSLVTEGQATLVVLVHCSSIAEVLSRIHLQSQASEKKLSDKTLDKTLTDLLRLTKRTDT